MIICFNCDNDIKKLLDEMVAVGQYADYAEAINNRLCITLSEDEKLTVWDPAECEINRTVFTIGKASRVLWEWFSYGKAKEPENLCRQDYQVVEREIKVVTNYQPYELSKPDLSELAIEICRIETSG